MRRPKIRLDLGAGQHPTPGFAGVDLWQGADHQVDLFTFPWPWADRTVDEIVSNHFVEHIPMTVTPAGQDLLCAFMDEIWRISRPDATVTIRHPHLQSERAFQDPTHRRFIPGATWCYFNAEWRKANGLDHYPIVADFEIVTISGDGIDNDTINRHHEVQWDRYKRNWNEIQDTVVILKARR